MAKSEEPRYPTWWAAVVAAMGPLLVRRMSSLRTLNLLLKECQSVAHRLLRRVATSLNVRAGDVRLDVAGPVLNTFADTSVVDNRPLAAESPRQLLQGQRECLQCLTLGRLHEAEANAGYKYGV